MYRPHPRKRALRCTEGRREDRPSFLLFAVTGVLGGREGTAGGGGARWAPIRFGGVVRAGGTVASPLGSQGSAHGTTHLHSRPTPSWHRCTEGAGRNRASSFFLCAETGSWMEAVKGALGTNPRWRSCQSRWAVATVPWATDSMTDPTGHRSLPAAVHPQRDIALFLRIRRGVGNQMAGADVETPNTLGGLPSVNWEGGLLSWAALHFVGHGRARVPVPAGAGDF